MSIKIKKGIPSGTIFVPPSKSYSHRYLIGGMLSGTSKIHHLSYSDDIVATLSCILSYGVLFQKEEDNVTFLSSIPSAKEFECYESGSTLRFFLPLALTKMEEATFIGSPRLIERGVEAYEKCFAPFGIRFEKENDRLTVKGKLRPGTYHLDTSQSSQYLTGLLFALPLLDGDSTIVLEGEMTSKPYIDITLDVLSHFGIHIQVNGNQYFVKGNQTYQSIETSIEGDYSNAAPMEAWNHFNGHIGLTGLKEDSLQGDKIYRTLFGRLDQGNCFIDLTNCIDLGPLLFCYAALKNGASFIGTSRLAKKESDRRMAMKTELEKLGAKVEIEGDRVKISPIQFEKDGIILNSHNDHRIAMALTLLASRMDIVLEDPTCVSKSYPEFFRDLAKLKMEVNDEKIA